MLAWHCVGSAPTERSAKCEDSLNLILPEEEFEIFVAFLSESSQSQASPVAV